MSVIRPERKLGYIIRCTSHSGQPEFQAGSQQWGGGGGGGGGGGEPPPPGVGPSTPSHTTGGQAGVRGGRPGGGGGGALEGWGETSVSRKGVRIREALGLSVQGQAWISGGQKSIIPGILELGSEPVWSPSPIAKLQLTSSPCSQGLYTPPRKLSGQ